MKELQLELPVSHWDVEETEPLEPRPVVVIDLVEDDDEQAD